MVPLFCVLTLLPWPPDHGDIHSVLPDHPPGRLDQKNWGTDFQFYRRALGPSTSASDSTIFKTRNETTVNDVLHAQSSAPRDAPCDAGGFCDDLADLHGKPHFFSGRPKGSTIAGFTDGYKYDQKTDGKIRSVNPGLHP